MKKIILTLSIVLFVALPSFGQTEVFSTGWYFIKSGAQVKVVQGNTDDIATERDWVEMSFAANEVLIAFNFQKDKYYCYDPEGRVVIVKGKASLQKIEVPGRPGHITQEIKLDLDNILNYGTNVWLIGINSSTTTATILLADGKKVEIPQGSIQDLKEYFDIMDKYTDWKTVE